MPPEPIEIRDLSSRDELWDEAQGATIERTVVTTDRSDPATAGLAWIYHLEGASIFRVGDPNWAYHERTVDGREVRIGADPAGDGNIALVASESGAFVVGGVRLTEPQVVDLVLAGRLVGGAVELGEDLPAGFEVVETPAASVDDNRSAIGWIEGDGGSWTLTASPSSLEDVLLGTGHVGAEPVTVRGTTGFYLPTVPGRMPATLIWVERGHVFSLAQGDDQQPGDPGPMVAVADRLQGLDQPALVERLGDRVVVGQAEVVADWLRATPPPDGWDVSPLIEFVPQSELQMASRTRQFLECAWLAEWADAVRSGDGSRREEAQAVLADESRWPVAVAEVRAREAALGDTDPSSGGAGPVIGQRPGELAAAETATDVDRIEQLYGCAFLVPN